MIWGKSNVCRPFPQGLLLRVHVNTLLAPCGLFLLLMKSQGCVAPFRGPWEGLSELCALECGCGYPVGQLPAGLAVDGPQLSARHTASAGGVPAMTTPFSTSCPCGRQWGRRRQETQRQPPPRPLSPKAFPLPYQGWPRDWVFPEGISAWGRRPPLPGSVSLQAWPGPEETRSQAERAWLVEGSWGQRWGHAPGGGCTCWRPASWLSGCCRRKGRV